MMFYFLCVITCCLSYNHGAPLPKTWLGFNCKNQTGASCETVPITLGMEFEIQYQPERIRDIGRKGNVRALFEIAKSFRYQVTNREMAARIAVELSSTQEAITLCTQLSGGSSVWASAFHALRNRQKHEIIGYLGDVLQSADPYMQANCYSFCADLRWDDFVTSAKRDADSNLPIVGINCDFNYKSLGEYAREYLEACENDSYWTQAIPR